MPTNDNDPHVGGLLPPPDPHGQAALLLVESLIHGLQERAVLTADDAIDIVDTALDVQGEIAEAADGAGRPMWQSHALLSSISQSLKRDGGDTLHPDGRTR